MSGSIFAAIWDLAGARRRPGIMLETLRSEAGAATVISLGRQLGQPQFIPVFHALCATPEPAVVMDKWRRLEGYGGVARRTEMTVQEGSVLCHRRPRRGAPARCGENLLICGVLAGLLGRVGVRALAVDILPARGRAVPVIVNGAVVAPPRLTGRAGRWRFRWQGLAPQPRPGAPLSAGLPADAPAIGPVAVPAAVRLLERDPGRHWRLAELAARVGMSGRSFQRRFAEGGGGFAALVRRVRIREACRLLALSSFSIAEIGYWCGYADTAHFSRVFQGEMGLPPSVYRAAAVVGAGLTRA